MKTVAKQALAEQQKRMEKETLQLIPGNSNTVEQHVPDV